MLLDGGGSKNRYKYPKMTKPGSYNLTQEDYINIFTINQKFLQFRNIQKKNEL